LLEAEAIQTARWQALTSFIRQWYYEPDIQALGVLLSVAHAHYSLNDMPVWALALGEPGSGKTELMMQVLSGFAPVGQDGRIPIVKSSPSAPHTNVYILDDLSDKTLLSGFQKRGKINPRNSLLHLLGNSILFLMPDFTLFLSKRKEVQEEIMGNLRRVWDGHLTKTLGNMDGQRLEWGPGAKATIIGAATPAIETRWSINNDLGNRFLIVRWRTGRSRIDMARYANRQIGKREYIRTEIRKLARMFIAGARTAEPASEEQTDNLIRLATVVAEMRRSVERNMRGEIVSVSDAEAPTRISMAMGQTARAHAGLFARERPNEEDLKIARRLGLDTIPEGRRKIVDAVAASRALSMGDLARELRQTIQTLKYNVNELEALGILEVVSGKDNGVPDSIMLDPEFRSLWHDAGLG